MFVSAFSRHGSRRIFASSPHLKDENYGFPSKHDDHKNHQAALVCKYTNPELSAVFSFFKPVRLPQKKFKPFMPCLSFAIKNTDSSCPL